MYEYIYIKCIHIKIIIHVYRKGLSSICRSPSSFVEMAEGISVETPLQVHVVVVSKSWEFLKHLHSKIIGPDNPTC